jgi:hypothetical protein
MSTHRLLTPRSLLRVGLGVALAWSFLPPLRANAPAGRYTIADNGIVYDTQTELTWQATDDRTARDFAGALAYCDALPLAGGGWRLPSVKELLSLLDMSRSNPAIDPRAFPSVSNASFWSGSDQVGVTGEKWFVYFPYGNLSWTAVNATNLVRCVR